MKKVDREKELRIIGIGDIHFGHKRTVEMVDELDKYFIKDLEENDYDLLLIRGDTFDRRFSANEPAVMFALLFMDKVVEICKRKNIMIRIIEGTKSHDTLQTETLFQQYLIDPELNIRYFKTTEIEEIKGIKFLFVPEEYPKNITEHYKPFMEEGCDVMVGHGMWDFVGMGDFEDNSETNIETAPVFSFKEWDPVINLFALFGHIHKRQIHKNKIFYPGSFTAWGFGDISDKGYERAVINTETKAWEIDLITNEDSPTYTSLKLNTLVEPEGFTVTDSEEIITLIEGLSEESDFTKVSMDGFDDEIIKIIREYYKGNKNITIDTRRRRKTLLESEEQEESKMYEKYKYILDDTGTQEEIIQQYILDETGNELTLERIKEIITE